MSFLNSLLGKRDAPASPRPTTQSSRGLRTPSGFGQILLVFRDQPASENPLDPRTASGVRAITDAIDCFLADSLREMHARKSAVPLLILCFPEFEPAVQTAVNSRIYESLPQSLLSCISLTRFGPDAGQGPSPVDVLNLLVDWVDSQSLRAVMVTPLSNRGATLDRRILSHVAQDDRPLTFEEIDYDNAAGPICGLYIADNNPRPAITPFKTWKDQQYVPEKEDTRATGTVYIGVGQMRNLFANRGATPTPLANWLLNALLSVGSAPLEQQLGVFEEAFSRLLLELTSRPLHCSLDRGARGPRRCSSPLTVAECNNIVKSLAVE